LASADEVVVVAEIVVAAEVVVAAMFLQESPTPMYAP
jgi:hypothetical protein